MYLVKEAVVPTRCFSWLRLGARNTGSREGKGAMKKTVILETSRTEQSLVGVESLGTGERSYVRTEFRRERESGFTYYNARKGVRERERERETRTHSSRLGMACEAPRLVSLSYFSLSLLASSFTTSAMASNSCFFWSTYAHTHTTIPTRVTVHVENEHYSYHILTTICTLHGCNSAVESPRKLKFRL